MKLLASAAALVCVLALGAVAAPAIAPSRWHPRPVDFEQRADPRAVVGKVASNGGFVSRPMRPGRRFNLVGFRWRGRAEPRIALRSRRAGGRWTRWHTIYAHAEDGPDPRSGEPAVTGVSTPAWVGEADYVQYRMTRRVPGLKLHFVNVQGTATAADRARTLLRRATNAAAISLAGALGGPDARAQAAQPAIVPRNEWGAASCPPRSRPAYGSVKAAFVHHTVNANSYSREEAPGIVLAICRYHRYSNGWDDIGYNFLVDKYGTLYEGRAGGIDAAVVGAQAQGYNAQSTGIANIGDHRSLRQSHAALVSMARLIRWKLPLHGAPTAGQTTLVSAGGSANRYPRGAHVRVERVLGHRDTGSTACPGEALYRQLPELRQLVGGLPAGSRLSARLSRRRVSYGSRVRLRGRLRAPSGAALAGRVVHVQVRRGRRWRTVARVRTARDGIWSDLLRPRGTRIVRARFRGSDSVPGGTSRRLRLEVRPLISVTVAPALPMRRQRLWVRGSIRPGKRRVYLVFQRREGRRWKKLSTRALRVRRGRFRAAFVPASSGAYRFYVVGRADRSSVRGRSKPMVLRVGRGSRSGGASARR